MRTSTGINLNVMSDFICFKEIVFREAEATGSTPFHEIQEKKRLKLDFCLFYATEA